MEHLDGILKLTEREFSQIIQNGKFRSREDIDNVYKLIDIVKDIYCIWTYEDELDGGYSATSYRGRSYTGNSYGIEPGRDMRSYRPGYSRRGMAYSRDDAKNELVDKIHEMMEQTSDEGKRQTLQKMIHQIENG